MVEQESGALPVCCLAFAQDSVWRGEEDEGKAELEGNGGVYREIKARPGGVCRGVLTV